MGLSRIMDICVALVLFSVFFWWFYGTVAPETERVTWSMQTCEVSRAEVVSPLYDLRAEGRWLVQIHAHWMVNDRQMETAEPWVFSEYPNMKVAPLYFTTKDEAQRVVDARFTSGMTLACYGQSDEAQRRSFSKPSWFQGGHLLLLWAGCLGLGSLLALSALYVLLAPYWFVLGSNRELLRLSDGLDNPPGDWVAIRLRDGGTHLRSGSSAFVHSVASLAMIVFLYGSYTCIWMSSSGNIWLGVLGIVLTLVGLFFGLLLMGHVLYEHRITVRHSEVSVQGFFGVPLAKKSVARHDVAKVEWMLPEELDDPNDAGLYVVSGTGQRVCVDDTSTQEVQRWLYALIQRWAGRES